jgi:hypothetical protein
MQDNAQAKGEIQIDQQQQAQQLTYLLPNLMGGMIPGNSPMQLLQAQQAQQVQQLKLMQQMQQTH